MKVLLEIAVFTIESALKAVQAGAHRLELCENAHDGGTTPSYGTLRITRDKISIPVFPIIRPRGGDFLYTADEFETMQKDVVLCKELGFEGIVTGMLLANGHIDIRRTARLVELAYPMDVTFHRAFDRAAEPLQSLEAVINCGCSRILTSGQVPDAWNGRELIKQLTDLAGDRIGIMPGSGVRSSNIKALWEYTGARELHSSARMVQPSAMQYHQTGMESHSGSVTVDENEIREMLQQLF